MITSLITTVIPNLRSFYILYKCLYAEKDKTVYIFSTAFREGKTVIELIYYLDYSSVKGTFQYLDVIYNLHH